LEPPKSKDGAEVAGAAVPPKAGGAGAAAAPTNEKPLGPMAAVLGAVVFVLAAELPVAVLPLLSRGTSHDMPTFFSFGFDVAHGEHFQQSLNVSPKEVPHPSAVAAGAWHLPQDVHSLSMPPFDFWHEAHVQTLPSTSELVCSSARTKGCRLRSCSASMSGSFVTICDVGCSGGYSLSKEVARPTFKMGSCCR
jgi:hypothetical protein